MNEPTIVNQWRTGPAPVGIVCSVWFLHLIVDAVSDGTLWRSVVTNHILPGVTHWMPKTNG